MTIPKAFQWLGGRDVAADVTEAGDRDEGASTKQAATPFAGYDKLDPKEITDALSDHSQVELTAVESYERSHENREAVLDKLRYMRSAEPVPGYDALSVEEILRLLEDADVKTIKAIRAYERKFANRREINDAVVHAYEARRAVEPRKRAPAYQSASASAAANGQVISATAKDQS